MNRRQFAAMFAGLAVCARPDCKKAETELEAIVGPYIPQRLSIAGWEIARGTLCEIRVYRSRTDFTPLLERHGIHAARRLRDGEEITYLIPFHSLADRAKAWETFAADPQWMELRSRATVNHLAIYRVL
jgi:hypothetical protein